MGCREVFVLLAGELSHLKEHSRLLSLPWRSSAKYKAHHLPLSSSTYLTESRLCVCRGTDLQSSVRVCSSCWVRSGAGAQVLLLLASSQNRRRLLNSFHLICCSSGPRQTDWSSALPREVAAGRTLFQRRRSSLQKSAPSTRGRSPPRPCSRLHTDADPQSLGTRPRRHHHVHTSNLVSPDIARGGQASAREFSICQGFRNWASGATDASSPRVTSPTQDAAGTLRFGFSKSHSCCSRLPVGRVQEEGAANWAESEVSASWPAVPTRRNSRIRSGPGPPPCPPGLRPCLTTEPVPTAWSTCCGPAWRPGSLR